MLTIGVHTRKSGTNVWKDEGQREEVSLKVGNKQIDISCPNPEEVRVMVQVGNNWYDVMLSDIQASVGMLGMLP